MESDKKTSNPIGTAGLVFGILLIGLGSIDLIRQLATGVPVPQIQWMLFLLVGGPGLAIALSSSLVANWTEKLSDAAPEDGDDDYGDTDYVDDDGGDAGE